MIFVSIEMKAGKVIGLILLNIILLISLLTCGAVLPINNSLLSKYFIPNQLDKLEITPVVEEMMGNTAGLRPEVSEAIRRAVKTTELQIKNQIRAANYQIYDYLLGRSSEINLRQVLKNTVLSREFLADLLNEADILTLLQQGLRDQLVEQIPSDQRSLVTYLEQAMPELNPWLQQQVDVVIDPVVDYLLGESTFFRIEIELEPMFTILKSSMRDAFLRAPPPELTGKSLDELDDIFNRNFDVGVSRIATTAVIDPQSLGISETSPLVESTEEASIVLANIRNTVSYFRVFFIVLIISIIVVTAVMVLVYRRVKGAALNLGIILLVFGVLQYIEVLSIKYSVKAMVATAELPDTVRAWIPSLLADFFRPSEILSMVACGTGAGLIAVAIIYRHQPPQTEQSAGGGAGG